MSAEHEFGRISGVALFSVCVCVCTSIALFNWPLFGRASELEAETLQAYGRWAQKLSNAGVMQIRYANSVEKIL